MSAGALIHATVVAVRGGGRWRGVLVRGASGAGKSDLALRLIGRGWRLVADDYAHVWRSQTRLYAAAPETIAGRIEIRGLGVLTTPHRTLASVDLIVDATERPERMPEALDVTLCGVAVPGLGVSLLHPSSVDLVAAAVERL